MPSGKIVPRAYNKHNGKGSSYKEKNFMTISLKWKQVYLEILDYIRV